MTSTQRKYAITAFAVILFLIFSVYFILSFKRFVQEPMIPQQTTVDYVFPAGSSVEVLAKDLSALGVLKNTNQFIFLAYLKGYATHLQAGEYRFAGGMTPVQILQKIVAGDVVYRQLTFIEGWNFQQMLDALANDPILVHQVSGLPPAVVMIELGLPGINPEGLFFPDTYRYAAGMSDKTILLQSYHAMEKNLLTEWQNRDPNLPYATPYDALIVASIIEKEAQVDSDRPIISGVILRRLQRGMKLDMDSTVLYGMGPNFRGPLTRNDLRTNTPYNTYMNKGLPPTPIAMPSLASIHAALHPASGNVMYFVSRGDGTHQFSVTYQQQKAAIKKYES